MWERIQAFHSVFSIRGERKDSMYYSNSPNVNILTLEPWANWNFAKYNDAPFVVFAGKALCEDRPPDSMFTVRARKCTFWSSFLLGLAYTQNKPRSQILLLVTFTIVLKWHPPL